MKLMLHKHNISLELHIYQEFLNFAILPLLPFLSICLFNKIHMEMVE